MAPRQNSVRRCGRPRNGPVRKTPRTEGSDVANATCQMQATVPSPKGHRERRPGRSGAWTTRRSRPAAGPATESRLDDGLSGTSLVPGREAGDRAAALADEWVRRAAAASVGAALRAQGYDGLRFQSVAGRAGLNGDEYAGRASPAGGHRPSHGRRPPQLFPGVGRTGPMSAPQHPPGGRRRRRPSHRR